MCTSARTIPPRLSPSSHPHLSPPPPSITFVRESVRVVLCFVIEQAQACTQYGGQRPFGVSLLVAGWDCRRGFQLITVDPAGNMEPCMQPSEMALDSAAIADGVGADADAGAGAGAAEATAKELSTAESSEGSTAGGVSSGESSNGGAEGERSESRGGGAEAGPGVMAIGRGAAQASRAFIEAWRARSEEGGGSGRSSVGGLSSEPEPEPRVASKGEAAAEAAATEEATTEAIASSKKEKHGQGGWGGPGEARRRALVQGWGRSAALRALFPDKPLPVGAVPGNASGDASGDGSGSSVTSAVDHSGAWGSNEASEGSALVDDDDYTEETATIVLQALPTEVTVFTPGAPGKSQARLESLVRPAVVFHA